jgi:hypothetical protein
VVSRTSVIMLDTVHPLHLGGISKMHPYGEWEVPQCRVLQYFIKWKQLFDFWPRYAADLCCDKLSSNGRHALVVLILISIIFYICTCRQLPSLYSSINPPPLSPLSSSPDRESCVVPKRLQQGYTRVLACLAMRDLSNVVWLSAKYKDASLCYIYYFLIYVLRIKFLWSVYLFLQRLLIYAALTYIFMHRLSIYAVLTYLCGAYLFMQRLPTYHAWFE